MSFNPVDWKPIKHKSGWRIANGPGGLDALAINKLRFASHPACVDFIRAATAVFEAGKDDLRRDLKELLEIRESDDV